MPEQMKSASKMVVSLSYKMLVCTNMDHWKSFLTMIRVDLVERCGQHPLWIGFDRE